jgi:sulfite reductase beta subunit-like hemoprotein
VTKAHDIGLRMVRNDAGEPGFEVIVGGGLGRTPMIGHTVRDFLPKADLLPYLEAILQRLQPRFGRRDNKYKARIKILGHETGIDAITAQIEAAYARTGASSRPRSRARSPKSRPPSPRRPSNASPTYEPAASPIRPSGRGSIPTSAPHRLAAMPSSPSR